jgi:hypothetical protein
MNERSSLLMESSDGIIEALDAIKSLIASLDEAEKKVG